MALQAKIYQKDGQSKEKLASFFESAKNEIVDPKLKELFTKIMDDTP
jgi:putative hydrolase of HD superfamily